MGLRDKARESASKPVSDAADEIVREEQAQPPPGRPLEAVPARQPGALELSVTYLVEGEKPDLAYSLFTSASAQGMRGMVVSRTYPKNLRKALDLRDAPVYWLTNAVSDEAIGPKDLERLSLGIKRFLDEGGGQRGLIGSLEYVITNNKFVSVLRLVETIRDLIAIHKAVGIIALKSSTLEASKLASIQRELEVYSADKSVSAPAVPKPPSETPVIAELRQHEIMLEAEPVGHERHAV